jgi:hypothetical protein
MRNMESVGCNDISIYNPGKKGRDYGYKAMESLLEEDKVSEKRSLV